MKILFIITGLDTGGAERQVCNLADALSDKGYLVKIVSLIERKETGVIPRSSSVHIIYLNMTKSVVSFFPTYLKLKKVIGDFQPDVVHSHMFHANLLSRLLKLVIKIPKLICTAHSKNEGGMLRMLAYRLTNNLSDLNTNVSQEAVDEFVRKAAFKQGQMIAVGNGIDTFHFCKKITQNYDFRKKLNISQDTHIFVSVGRLTDAKDYPNLLDAFAIVEKVNKNVALLIVGKGELERELKLQCSKLELDSKVFFLGLRRDIPELMNVANTYVMSSSFEGLPLVIGEAMACENIVVSTDCGGAKEIVGECGFLVPIQDSKALAAKMLYTMNIPETEREKLGKKARERIQEYYSLDVITQQWLDLYRK